MKASEFEKLNAEVARVCSSARSEFDAQLEAANSEIADLKRQLEDSSRGALACANRILQQEQKIGELHLNLEVHEANAARFIVADKSMQQQLTESTAREARLREAMQQEINYHFMQAGPKDLPNIKQALTIPHDDTALREYRDAVIELCALKCAMVQELIGNWRMATPEDCAEFIRNMKGGA